MKKMILIIMIIGGINWGLIGFFDYNLVASIFGANLEIVSRIIYAVVGWPRCGELLSYLKIINAPKASGKLRTGNFMKFPVVLFRWSDCFLGKILIQHACQGLAFSGVQSYASAHAFVTRVPVSYVQLSGVAVPLDKVKFLFSLPGGIGAGTPRCFLISKLKSSPLVMVSPSPDFPFAR